ncbi:hypothetical protein T261_4240 [Streptomyces lydicus]|nr:hypothetical protein T261_4240 [Streptomyces lydicus]
MHRSSKSSRSRWGVVGGNRRQGADAPVAHPVDHPKGHPRIDITAPGYRPRSHPFIDISATRPPWGDAAVPEVRRARPAGTMAGSGPAVGPRPWLAGRAP